MPVLIDNMPKEGPSVFIVRKGDTTLAFCPHCDRMLYKGGDRSVVEHRVLRNQILGHINRFRKRHFVDVIFPHRKTSQVIDFVDYLQKGLGSPSYDDIFRQSPDN